MEDENNAGKGIQRNFKRKKWNPKFKVNNGNRNYGHSTPSTSKVKVRNLDDFSCDAKNIWTFYLSDKYPPNDVSLLNKLKVIEEYLVSSFTESLLIDVDKYKRFVIDLKEILQFKSVSFVWPDLKEELVNNPEMVIGLFGLAMEQLIRNRSIRDSSESTYDTDKFTKINPRFTRLGNNLRYQDLKTYNYGKFISMTGIIVRSSDVKPFCTQMAFMCVKCQTIQVCDQEKGCYTPPNRCIGKECFSCTFKPLLKSPLTCTIPWKTVRLQELNADQSEGGRVPRSIDCELLCDLTDSCTPGDIVVIAGTVAVNNTNDKKTNASGKDACTYALYVNANSVTCLKGKDVKAAELSTDSFYFKSDDLSTIKEIHSRKNLFKLVVDSLCPNIYGHNLVKAGIVLALFGGGEGSSIEGHSKKFTSRENSHILIVGDPGLGKSQMLLASSDMSPRGVYVCGNSTTASGLTVTISKESGGENSLEAGALVLADQGHCCIDEFDKMMHQHSALLEAMEQQTISIAKSGMVCTLPARTSIIAAANPSGGHYNKGKTVAENLKIKGSLLSRFDLVFIIQDRPDKAFDGKMSDHVMALHSANQRWDAWKPNRTNSLTINSQISQKLEEPTVSDELIPPKMLQKYISYARKFSQPKLTPEVNSILQKFYLEMRRQQELNYSTPITTRQLESLVRLTKTRARVELRPFCSVHDAEEVIEIMKYSMQDVYSDEHGNIDFDRSIHGSGMSNRSQAKKLINILTKTAAHRGDDCFAVSEIKELAKKAKISQDSFSTLLETLNDTGYLLKKGYQLYQIQTT